ncbi:hypothetical protein LTR36_004081 [Oleoguttula mirabilis]|uniref:PRISE-like Rossmann-fold domain-containing protein n=1 Tax=Oleoguttula mirabilis TaxID=1507867 RepID=A0AAV9JI05_9PEZI|nr:hypothetical protein LTR36_004081 [Oleoguttula mirabilis]
MANPPTKQTVLSHGIFHGLPDLSDAPTGLTAIVTGANGISGAHMIRVLSQTPARWTKIYALSRRPPSGKWPEQVEHIPLDFLKSPDDIASVLKDRNITGPVYVFWFAYILVTDDSGALQWGDQRLIDQNNLILTNFLEALPRASLTPTRIFLQYGQKWYGVHLGATSVPDSEDDARLNPETGGLYYTQHDLLTTFCGKHSISWNAALPSFVIGAALDSSQSLLYPILMYASVQKHLGRKLEYPSDVNAWLAPLSLSNAVLDSHMYEWSVLSPQTANQMFNASDDCAFTWGKFWPKLAAYFDMPYTGPETGSDVEYKEKSMPGSPPPHGMGGEASVMRYRFSFVEWAKQAENVNAWKELAQRHALRDGEWKDIGSIFGRADFALLRPYPSLMSTAKAKKHGWFGFVDSSESILSVADEFVAMKTIPSPASIGRS